MPEIEDWLQDPLRKIENGTYKNRKLNVAEENQNELWGSFHYSTRLKLDGADYFCRQALGSSCLPDNLGLPLLAYRQLQWSLGAFFFTLMSAYDTLKQELNIIYAYDLELKGKELLWSKIQLKLPREIVARMKEEWQKEWFCAVRSYRNTATHEYLVPVSSGTLTVGEEPLDFREHDVYIHYRDEEGNFKSEKISICKDYLRNMAKHIISVWEAMEDKFD